MAFTLSQAGMVVHWWRLRAEDSSWRWRATLNGIGALATGLVAIVVGVAKFGLGAWMVLVLLPILILMMWGIRRHYREFEDALTLEYRDIPVPRLMEPRVIVPVSRLDYATLQSIAYAQSISQDVTAVHITDDPQSSQSFKHRWETSIGNVPLIIVESPYRSLTRPLLAYIEAAEKQDPGRAITVVLSQYVPTHFWEWLLHNQMALRLKLLLFFRRNTVVIDVPYRVK
jgi:hypothetical protein